MIPNFLTENAEYDAPLYFSKVVTRKKTLSKKERIEKLEKAGFNVFAIDAEGINIDLLTDSGTGSISDKQLSVMMMGDESYAGSSSFQKMKDTITELTGLPYVIPCHQGRAAEKTFNYIMLTSQAEKEQIKFFKNLEKPTDEQIKEILSHKGDFVPNVFVPGNTHFDTTESHIYFHGGQPIDFTVNCACDSSSQDPFKGNVDIEKLKTFIEEIKEKYNNVKEHIPYFLLTITCNSGGGQPVSLENIKSVSEVCKAHEIPLFFDAARYAENAYFIWEREKKADIKEIIKEMFSYVDGCLMSSKKDAIVPMGGFIALRDSKLYESISNLNVLFEGFKTYGGMSGLMMEALAQGLRESADLDYLKDRIELVRYLGEKLKEKGIPIVEPIGGHAVFIDARKFYAGVIPDDQFPAQVLTAYLFMESGVRGVECGCCMKGRDPATGENRIPKLDLMRMAIPRRKYCREHMDVVIKSLDYLYKNREKAKGFRIFEEPDTGIRHFTAKFKIVE